MINNADISKVMNNNKYGGKSKMAKTKAVKKGKVAVVVAVKPMMKKGKKGCK